MLFLRFNHGIIKIADNKLMYYCDNIKVVFKYLYKYITISQKLITKEIFSNY